MIKKEILSAQDTGLGKQAQTDDAYFRSIIENNSFYIIKTDLDGNYTYLNPFFCKMLNVKSEEWLGKNSLTLVMQQDHDICVETVQLCFEDPDTPRWVMLRKPIPNGVLFTQWEFKILKDDHGNPFEFLCIGHDITPLILKQEELRSLVDIAAEQNKRLLNFTYLTSHNIRSHVANIQGILNISQELGDYQSALDLIQESTTSLNDTLNNLNEIISIQAHTSLPMIEVNVFEEIDRVIQSIQVIISNADVRVEYIFEGTQVLNTNPAYFESIILNLLTNAVKYRSPERALRIVVSFYEHEHYKILTFQDNGLGIDIEKYKDQLFGMYKTFHKNNDSRGLGLYITKTQIEAMHGKIEVESSVNEGTTFKIYFNQKFT